MTDVSGGRPPTDPSRPGAQAPLDAPLDRERLAARGIEVLDQTPSTNAVVAERAREGAAEGLVVVTEHQTAGRGRLDRGWSTPPRSALPFSVLLRPSVEPALWPWLPLLTGYAVVRTLVAAGYRARLKWPNDVLVDGRKVAGILVERVEGPAGPAAVVGIGLNVRLPADALPVETATSLLVAADEPGQVPDRTDLLEDLVDTLVEGYDAWEAGGTAAQERLRASYTAACATVGVRVRVALPDGTDLVGEAEGVDENGRLVVRSGGASHAVGAGDVVHVRPAGER